MMIMNYYFRLTRVRQRVLQTNSTISTDERCIELFGDYAFVSSGALEFGQVNRMRKRRTRGYTEYRLPVSFQEKELNKINVLLRAFNKNTDMFTVSDTIKEITADNIISEVNLTYDDDRQCYSIDEEELSIIRSAYEDRKRRERGKQKKKTVAKQTRGPVSIAEASGRIRTIVQPAEEGSGCLRRSSRPRTVISNLSDFI